MARDLGPGHTIVTVLCDYGTRYQSKLFNPEFLREKGLPARTGCEQRSFEAAVLVAEPALSADDAGVAEPAGAHHRHQPAWWLGHLLARTPRRT